MATIEQNKPLVLMCDHMFDSPSVLEDRKNECRQSLREAIFGPPSNLRDVIPWLRLPEFQRESLRLIATKVLKETPLLRNKEVDIHTPGDCRSQRLNFEPPVQLAYSSNNPV